MNARRVVLEQVSRQPTTHPGLWFERYLTAHDPKEEKYPALVREVAKIKPAPLYASAFKRWRNALERAGAAMREGEVEGRLVVGLGQESVIETHVALHRTYGMPLIPGSAIKGAAAAYTRRYAGEAWQEDGEAYRIVFGNTKSTGFIRFFDAWYIPEGTAAPLHTDVITVHHRDYYQDTKPPTDQDDPNPVLFLSCTGKYLFALSGPEAWVESVFTILTRALGQVGIGAKSSSGYGRIKLAEIRDPDMEKADELCRRIENLKPQDCNAQLGQYVDRLLKEFNPASGAGLKLAGCIKQKVAALERKQRKRLREKDWYSRVEEIVGGDAA